MPLKSFFTANYQFSVNSAMLDRGDSIYLLFGAVFILLSVSVKIAAVLAPNPVDKKYRDSFFNALLTAGIWEIVWFALRWQNIRFFGSHFIALLGLLIGVAWIATKAVFMFRHYALEKESWEKDQVKLKYLPRQ